jgi:transposase-like protein
VLETALAAEMSQHLEYDNGDPSGRNGENSRNGVRTKALIADIESVTINVPRDRQGTFTRLDQGVRRGAIRVRLVVEGKTFGFGLWSF